MAARSQLPIEILSIINTYTADWVGLENLCQVFPQVADLFAGDANSKADLGAIRLVESILKENPIMSHELHRHFRMIMKLQQPSLADSNITIFMDRDYSLSSMACSLSITRGMLQEIVATAANIQRLACACLAALLTRLRKVQPRRWVVHMYPENNCCRVTGTVPYEQRDAGPPSWIEEYRVYRALWHLQLHCDLLIVAERLKWPQTDYEKLWADDMDWNEFVPMASEVHSVSECLERLFRDNIGSTTKLSVESNSNDIVLITKIPNATHLPREFDVWSPPSPTIILHRSSPSTLHDIWGRAIDRTQRNRMTAFWRFLQARTFKNPLSRQTCSLQDSRPWRALGMPIWDLWRFYELGLWKPERHGLLESGPILNPDGVEIPEGGDPPIHGDDVGYRFSVFIEASVQMELQEKMGR